VEFRVNRRSTAFLCEHEEGLTRVHTGPSYETRPLSPAKAEQDSPGLEAPTLQEPAFAVDRGRPRACRLGTKWLQTRRYVDAGCSHAGAQLQRSNARNVIAPNVDVDACRAQRAQRGDPELVARDLGQAKSQSPAAFYLREQQP
jgi:hypothetical protein